MKASMKNPLTLAFAALLACQAPCPTPTPTAAPSAHVLAFPGPFPGNAAQGSLPYYGDAGFPVVLPVGLAGQPLFSGGAGANPYFGPGGNFLAISGVTTAPPTVAGGGWAIVNATGSGTVVPSDAPYGIELAVPGTLGAIGTGLGYVRAGSGSPTMSVEVGAVAVNNGVSGSFVQQMYWGAQFYEQATGKWIAIYLVEEFTSNAQTGTLRVIVEGSGIAEAQAESNLNSYTQPFVRLRLDGAGHIVCEFSVDKNRWTNPGAAFTFPVATVFTVGPDHVGIGIAGANVTGAETFVSVFDFATT